MDSVKESATNTIRNEPEWSVYNKQLFNEVPQTPHPNTIVQDSIKIKMEIELKEEQKELIYEPDIYGHLRLVSLNQNVPNNCIAVESKYSALPEWHCTQPVSKVKEANIVPTAQNNILNSDCIYGQLKNISCDILDDIKEMSTLNHFKNSVTELPEIVNTFEKTLQQNATKSSQVCKKQRNRQNPIILAKKKREYRMRIKEENPTMWCAMKQKEACKKREQREEKRLILLQMQKMMQHISVPHSPEVENHKLHLEALKQKYPEIWKQLIDALSAAEQRNEVFKNVKNSERHLSKPINMYKDVVEAQKKYLYRQRMKLERPELYKQQKARDSYARSAKRMLNRKLDESQNNIDN